ncbi:hypothetical protein [Haloarchaeobius sp. HME9146]|uniref:DUF7836 family putative zinc-binding protein n=1 Tax=Haloarchaeobius sp. HME9146 TaxID=2978732 RepID=UPI0021C04A46|nr:hypothetical protein [Haloarchaeobius sp. HME9146]MCT9098303.1 hypothetical protein [Haloarchaeobius sp. HME9146]
MQQAWIQLQCSACDEGWEANPAQLPEPKRDFTCKHCGTTRRMAEFAQTQTDLRILKEFHGA